MIQATPITDRDNKLDIMEHVNQEHPEAVLSIVQSFSDYKAAVNARITDLYQEGMLIEFNDDKADGVQEAFIPFRLKGELEEQILYLAFLAMHRQGKTFAGKRKQFFTVTGTEMLTDHILRLYIESPAPLPEHQPGYAYRFALKRLKALPGQAVQENDNHQGIRLLNRAMLWLMKQLSPRRRKTIIAGMNKGARYYTLRYARRSGQAAFADCGVVDIYLHGDTPGSDWARSLKTGDVIYSLYEHHDRHAHLHSGKALLIGDETAYPAIAALLESWQNTAPPHLIILSAQAGEQEYFTEAMLPEGSTVSRIVCPVECQGEQVTAAILQLPPFDCCWAALESAAATSIRRYLRNHYGLSGQNNQIKAYWHLQDKQ